MNLLLLGGTKFLGRHLTDAALARDHTVTLFHRGETGADLFPELEHILGDRTEGLDALAGREFDAVIDTSGYLPRVVRDSARALADSVKHYTFVSSISVYADHSKAGNTENTAVGILEDVRDENVAKNYGPLKGLCEQVVEREFPGRTLVIRPGLIVGPHDPSDRFTYWVDRMARNGEVVAPGDAEHAVQFVDVRDLASWMTELIERETVGVMHATGPESATTLGEVLDCCRTVAKSAAGESDNELVWMKPEFLAEQKIGEWMDMPLWINDPAFAGHSKVDCSRALAAGLRFRSVEETVRDTLEWCQSRPTDHEWKAGLTSEREAEILKTWRQAESAR
ncbi:MAG: 2'-hydroxyisoflavone reductase [Planctomycetota bacterium]|jgi:2'-hydroxyisoflavone reductase